MPRALPAAPAWARIATWTIAVLIALAVPAILVVDGFRMLATDTFVEWELGRDSFPPDLYGFTNEQRTSLAKLGLRSIEPGTQGIVLLERATLPNGSPAFVERELTHMQDVRTLFVGALPGAARRADRDRRCSASCSGGRGFAPPSPPGCWRARSRRSRSRCSQCL